MAVSLTPHRWTLDEYLLAWEAGAIDKRVELLDGEVWDVSMGPWHGDTTMRVARELPNDRFRITAMSLPTGDSLPDPGCSVLRMDASPVEQLSPRNPVYWSGCCTARASAYPSRTPTTSPSTSTG